VGAEAIAIGLVAALILAKLVATVATVGLGGSGGTVLPAFVMGALCGTLVAGLFGVPVNSGAHLALRICGMTALLGSALNVPVAAAVIMMEVFGKAFAVPIVLGASLGFFVGRPAVLYSYNREGVAESPGPSG